MADMLAAGQQALVAYLNGTSYPDSPRNTGGLDAAASGPFAALVPYLPATSSGFVAGASTTDTQATAEAIIDQGLAANFTLATPLVPRSGTAGEAALAAKNGATVFCPQAGGID